METTKYSSILANLLHDYLISISFYLKGEPLDAKAGLDGAMLLRHFEAYFSESRSEWRSDSSLYEELWEELEALYEKMVKFDKVLVGRFNSDEIFPLVCEAMDVMERCKPQQAEKFQREVEEPQGKKSKGKPGRPIKDNFSDVIVHRDKKKTLEKLHKVANGKNGKDFALVMQAAMELGWINKPSFNQVGKEFGNIGGSSVFYGYIGTPSKFLQEDLNRVKNRLQNEL